MTESSNIVDHPYRHHASLRRLRATQLKEAFLARGKMQPEILARLSCTVEKLCLEAKTRFGPRSGAMQRAFGDDLVRMKSRFTARGGEAPAQIYQTPEAWLRVIVGFASVLDQDPEGAIVSALEDALSHARPMVPAGPAHWLEEFQALVGHMIERLRSEDDLMEIADYVARSGLMLIDGEVSVTEWPFDHIGYSADELYNTSIIGLVPHVLGVNYVPVTSVSHAMDDFRDELVSDIPELGYLDSAKLAASTGFSFNEGIRTGVAAVVYAHSREMELAILEWHHADVTLTGADGVIATIETDANLHELAGGDVPPEDRSGWIGTPASFDAFRRPEAWVANTVRFHFPGSAGFERLASSLLVRPWNYVDPAGHYLWTPAPEDAESCPVASPRHSVAAAIEGNLLYADVEGRPDHRLDRLLLAEIRRVSTIVQRFRTENEARRLASREVLLAQWNAEHQG